MNTATLSRISALDIDLWGSKLHPPPQRQGIVERTALLGRLALLDHPVVCLSAPAGYGKTTLLSQWSDQLGPRASWVTLDDNDNDPAMLVSVLAAALDRDDDLSDAVIESIVARRPVRTVMSRLLAWMNDDLEPFTLVLDQADSVTSPDAFDLITQLALELPAQHRLFVASRSTPPWPAPRLRAHGRLLELGHEDLAMDPAESAELLRLCDVALTPSDIDELTTRTEGWPAGLYLSALAMRSRPDARPVAAPRGNHRYLAEYFRSEVLVALPVRESAFLTRTSVLDGLCGPLCDAVLETTDASQVLDDIARQNLFLQAVDDEGGSYRVHQLFGDLLSTELARKEPALIPDLHRRAAEWCESNGLAEDALGHAQAAGDAVRAVALIEQLIQPAWGSGRIHTVMGWLQWLADEDLLAVHPPLAVHGSLLYAMAGRPIQAERWADAAIASSSSGPLPDGSTFDGLVSYLRAYVCRDGIDVMGADARAATSGLSSDSPYRAGMAYVEGVAHRLAGRADEADAALAHALDVAISFDIIPQIAMTLVEQGGIAAGRGDWTEAGRSTDEALALIGNGTYDEYWSSAVVFASAARVAAHRDDPAAARSLLARATRLRPLLSYALPVTSARTLVEMARASIALGDLTDASAVIRQAHEITRQRPNLGLLADEIRAMQALPGAGTSLSAAELRIVPLLASHLTLQEIADRLFLSRHTVKSHSIAVYRKLGVSSRREAIDRLQEMGLLVS